MNYLANNFKILRKSKGLNQVQASLLLGFNRTTWNNYETGKSKPNIDDLLRITNYFGISTSDLLEGDLSNVELNGKRLLKKEGNNVELKVERNVEVNSKNEVNEGSAPYKLTEQNINYKAEFLSSHQGRIEDLKAEILYLRNQIEQMKIDRHEREQTQHTQKKEAKSA